MDTRARYARMRASALLHAVIACHVMGHVIVDVLGESSDPDQFFSLLRDNTETDLVILIDR